MRPLFSVLAVFFVMVSGCATQGSLRDLVGDQMSREYGCPTTSVDVVEAGEERFRASGCGETLAYVVHCESGRASSCVVIREHTATP
jgi:hypothetical protein